MGLLDRVNARAGTGVERRYSADQWISEYLQPAGMFGYGGQQYPYGITTTWDQGRVREISNTLPGYSKALRSCPPAFAAQMVRAMTISQARFTFRNRPSTATPRRMFGTRALSRLENPAPSVTTGELLARMEWHAGLAGNAYVLRQPNRLRVLRPDWVSVVFGSDQEPEDAAHALDGEIIGFVYVNGGMWSGNRPQTLLPSDVAHWCPLPDPELSHIGMSWITPAVREIQADGMATDHKIQFFRNGATPNMVVKGITAATKQQFDEIVDQLEARHTGVANAYRTLYLTAGADATVVGSNLQQIDFKSTQGSGETRLALLSRVPAPLLGISEGLAGSSLNAGNFGMARRMFADSWIYPTLQDLAGSLADIVEVPPDAELWFDTGDMPILREDAKDAAEIIQIKVATIVSAINGGLDPQSAIAAVEGQDVKLLKHTGMVSVQLQPPGTDPAAGAEPPRKALPAARSIPDPSMVCCDWDPAVEDPDPDDLYDDEESGRAVTPSGVKGGLQLKKYWTTGKGLAKWAGSPHPWTALYQHLNNYMPAAKAKRTAAQWFHDVFGIWPGHRKGKNKLGPG